MDIKPTKRYDQIWANVCSKSNCLVYCEVLWNEKFGSAFVTLTTKMSDDFKKSGEKYLQNFLKNTPHLVGKLPPKGV